MDIVVVIMACLSIVANIALVLAFVYFTSSVKSEINEVEKTINKQSELIVIMSQFLRKDDFRKQTEKIIFEKIQSSIREFNNRFKVNVVDSEKPLDFPNDEK